MLELGLEHSAVCLSVGQHLNPHPTPHIPTPHPHPGSGAARVGKEGH